MGTTASAAMAIAMIGAFLLGMAGMRLILGKVEKSRGVLMLAAAAVIVANVLIIAV